MSTDASESSDSGSIASTIIPSALRRRIVYKLTLSLLAVMVLMAAVGAVGYIQARDTVKDTTRDNLQSTATLHGESMSVWSDEMKEQTRSVSKSQEVIRVNTTQKQQFLTSSRDGFNADVYGVHFVNTTSGQVTASTNTNYRQQSFSSISKPWAQQKRYVGITAYSSVSVGNNTWDPRYLDDQLMSFVAPVWGVEDQYVVLTATIGSRVDALYQPGPDHETTVYDRSAGETLIDTQRSTLPSEVVQQPGAGESKFVVGADNVYAAAPINGTDWVSVTSAPRGTVFATTNLVGQFMLIVIGTGLAGLVVVGAIFGRQTAGPLRRLRDKAQTMESGNLEVSLETTREDEVGQLYQAFASMRDSLQTQIEEAEKARKEAEVSRAETEELNQHLQEKAQEYSEIMQACARGDLRQRFEEDGQNEVMDQIATDFNAMMKEQEMTVGQLKSFAEEVQESGNDVQHSAESIRTASEQIAESVLQISDSTANQRDNLEAIVDDIDELAEQLEPPTNVDSEGNSDDLRKTVRELESLVTDAVKLSEKTMTESENVSGAAEEQAAELNQVSAQAEELVRYARYLQEGLANFDTAEQHEFIFKTDVTSSSSDTPVDDKE